MDIPVGPAVAFESAKDLADAREQVGGDCFEHGRRAAFADVGSTSVGPTQVVRPSCANSARLGIRTANRHGGEAWQMRVVLNLSLGSGERWPP